MAIGELWKLGKIQGVQPKMETYPSLNKSIDNLEIFL